MHFGSVVRSIVQQIWDETAAGAIPGGQK